MGQERGVAGVVSTAMPLPCGAQSRGMRGMSTTWGGALWPYLGHVYDRGLARVVHGEGHGAGKIGPGGGVGGVVVRQGRVHDWAGRQALPFRGVGIKRRP